ncbi:AAA family ATPase [Candidatus Woesearchaeota archaeon]|nr:AAA family ATPase [Candidatus Woesearchaeota archaeon]
MLKTLSKDFDEFLNGGYKENCITLIYGPGGSGKTTLCLMATISAILEGKKVLFLDAENSFNVKRLEQIAGEKFKEVLDKISLIKVNSFNKQIELINKLVASKKLFDLIVIDTVTYFHRQEIRENENIDAKLRWHMFNIRDIARKGSVVLLTSQVYEDITAGKFKPVGEKVMNDKVDFKIRLQKDPRKALMKEREFLFEIYDGGIRKLN